MTGLRRRDLAALAVPALPALPALGGCATPGPGDGVPYRWQPVAIVGGGFVSGLAFHPRVPGLMLARTDMGGAYLRERSDQPWRPLLDALPLAEVNLMGVESHAFDPHDADALFLACGTYTTPASPNGALLRSFDRGRSWQRTPLPFKLGANEGGRGNGERLALDPHDGRVLYLGTRHDGLWRSTDRGASFQRLDGLPEAAWRRAASEGPLPAWGGSDGRGTIVFVLCDPRSGGAGRACRTLYAGISTAGRPSLWRSDDGGARWSPVPGAPQQHRPLRAALATDGRLYLAMASEPGPHRMQGGALWALDTASGHWTDISPEGPGTAYACVVACPQQPRRLLASTVGRTGGEELFLSRDGGAHWQALVAGGALFDPGLAPYVADTSLHWLYDVRIDPHDPAHALFTTGYGGWESFDLGAADQGRPTHWQVMSRGIEETVALALHSPTQGVPLVTALGDYSGFVHTDLDRPAPGNPKPPFFGNTHDVTGAEAAPELLLRIGHPRDGGPHLGWSLDGGRSWRLPGSEPPGATADGSIAAGADGRAWVWTPRGALPHVSHDHGDHWTAVRGLPPGTRVVADRVNPRRFHAMDLFGGRLFASVDGGASFTARPLALPDGKVARPAAGVHNQGRRGDDRGGQDRLYATPGREGELVLAAFHGLYRAADGAPFVRLPAVSEIHAFGFGRAAPGRALPTLFVFGTVEGRYGLFRSTDGGARWLRINDDAHQWGLVLQVSGDPKVFGRVYVGTHGRGVLYGDALR